MQDYKSLRVAVMICNTLFNTQTDTVGPVGLSVAFYTFVFFNWSHLYLSFVFSVFLSK